VVQMITGTGTHRPPTGRGENSSGNTRAGHRLPQLSFSRLSTSVIDYPSIETGPNWVRHPAHGTVIAIKVRAKRSLLIFVESNENGA
jgi:hypothetical protein